MIKPPFFGFLLLIKDLYLCAVNSEQAQIPPQFKSVETLGGDFSRTGHASQWYIQESNGSQCGR